MGSILIIDSLQSITTSQTAERKLAGWQSAKFETLTAIDRVDGGARDEKGP